LLPYLDQQPLYERVDQREDGAGLSSDPPGSRYNGELLNTTVPVFVCPSDGVAARGVSYRGCLGTSPGVHSTIPETEPDAAKTGVFVRFDGRALAAIKDGLSQTALFSERLVGDADGSTLTASRDIADMSRIPPRAWNFLRPSDVVRGCRLVTRSDLPHWSHAGSTWLLGGHTQTLYNHILPPNATIPDCGYASLGGAFQGAVSARSYHDGGVNVVFADGAARFVSENVDLSVWRALGSVRGEEVATDF
jgi:prepilin-type processing-associated H-X9-DG protein